MIQNFPQTASVHELQKNYCKLIDRAKQSKSPLYILKNNKFHGVFLDAVLWQKLVRKWEEDDFEKAIEIAEEEYAAGKITELSSLKELIDD